MSRKTRVAKNIDPALFEQEFDAVVTLQATMNDTLHTLHQNVIEFSVRYDAMIAEGKRLDKANKNKNCAERLISTFGNDYANKGTRSRYMSIASMADVFRQPEVFKNLPLAGRDALYYLSRLEAPQIESLVASGEITPRLTVSETKALVKDLLPRKKAKDSKDDDEKVESQSHIFDSVAITMHFKTIEDAVSILREPITNSATLRWSCENDKDRSAFKQMLKKATTRAAA